MIVNSISLWEPWASAMRLGIKTIETRSWGPPPYTTGRRLLICAAKKWSREQQAFLDRPDVQEALRPLRPHPARPLTKADLPLGKAVALVNLEGCASTALLRRVVSAIELLFGDYRDGRFGWQTSDLINSFEPFCVTGRQGVFTVQVPDSLVA